MSREAMQIALDALEANLGNWAAKTKAVEVLRQALGAEQKTAVSPGKGTGFNYFRASAITVLRQAQEPVAWASSLDFDDDDQEIIPAKDKGKLGTSNCDIPLYTAPPKHDYVIDCPRCGHCCAERTWAGLTDEEIQELSHLSQKIDASNSPWFDRLGFAKAIEQALKDKNA